MTFHRWGIRFRRFSIGWFDLWGRKITFWIERIDWEQQNPRWVSVRKRLPKRAEDLVLRTKDGKLHIGFFSTIGGFEYPDVTHWLSNLPRNPLEDK
jgi:hypothetical protein